MRSFCPLYDDPSYGNGKLTSMAKFNPHTNTCAFLPLFYTFAPLSLELFQASNVSN